MRKIKKIEDSLTEQQYFIRPPHINHYGRLFGGQLLKWIDELAGIVAIRHCGDTVTTAAIDNLQFHAPAYTGDMIVLRGWVTCVGKTSMEIRVDTYIETIDGNRQLINRAYIDMVAINIRDSYKQVLACVTENIYSRIPVYSGTVDNIKGILYIKDLLPHLNKGDGFRWQTLIRPAFFVPETKQIDDLLRDFQSSKVHIAIVVDEFGGTLGLVTLEDVIEEIVGEINDEYDEVERPYVKLNSNTYLF